jgi:hypothetical protein
MVSQISLEKLDLEALKLTYLGGYKKRNITINRTGNTKIEHSGRYEPA